MSDERCTPTHSLLVRYNSVLEHSVFTSEDLKHTPGRKEEVTVTFTDNTKKPFEPLDQIWPMTRVL